MTLRQIALIVGPFLAGLVYLLCRTMAGMDHAPAAAAAVTVLCAAWWCTEALPIPATALVPFALFPFLDVLDHSQLARAYGDPFILLFLGGFMLSKAAEKSDTHLRVARGMLRLVGTSSSPRIVIGFMLATAFCSMWISNTATALIMLPAAIAVIKNKPDAKKFTVALLLGIAYGASIGGVTTLIGTPPNGVFASIYKESVDVEVTFFDWFKVGIPVFVIMFAIAAFYLTRGLEPYGDFEMKKRTPWTPAQKRVLAVISLVAIGWITRTAPYGGWSSPTQPSPSSASSPCSSSPPANAPTKANASDSSTGTPPSTSHGASSSSSAAASPSPHRSSRPVSISPSAPRSKPSLISRPSSSCSCSASA